MSYIQTKVLSHGQRVRKLYKMALQEVRNWYYEPHMVRLKSVEMRARFDEHINEPDLRIAKRLVMAGEQELASTRHPAQLKYPDSPGGINFGREQYVSDDILDQWHPYERAQYPEYFERRALRKQEYIDNWEKMQGGLNQQKHKRNEIVKDSLMYRE